MAESEEQLLEQLREVQIDDYLKQRKHLAKAEAPRKFLARLHRDSAKTMQILADRYIAHIPVGQFVNRAFAVSIPEPILSYTC
jgi:hypothetical protein